MRNLELAAQLAAAASLFTLMACGGGGGGGGSAPASTLALSGNGTITSLPASGQVTIQPALVPAFPPGTSALIVDGTVLLSATSFSGTPTAPIPFALNQTILATNQNQVVSLDSLYGASLSWKGNQNVNGSVQPVFDFIDRFGGGEVTQLTGDGVTATDNKGNQVILAATTLNYTLFGVWTIRYSGPNALSHVGVGVDGFGTPPSAMPSSGTATYIGNGTNGGAIGLVFAPSNDGASIVDGALSGNTNLSVNFGAGTLSGSLTNMKVTSTADGSTTAWNNVNLSGTISNAQKPPIFGNTAAANTVSTPLGMNGSATGLFTGEFFGPSAQEIGATWTLHDPTGQGKTAIGVLGATKQ